MNINKFVFSLNETENKEATRLVEQIAKLVNKHNLERFFSDAPHFNGADMRKLTILVKQYEELYYTHPDHHHNVHLFCLDKITDNEWEIETYTKTYGDELTSEFVLCRGTSAKDVLKKFWETDKVPPCMVLNADYYIPQIRIKDLK